MLPFLKIRQNIRRAIREYNCPVIAYNVAFDYEALTNMAQDLGKQSFFTKTTQIWDLQNIALYTLCNSCLYTVFCDKNNFVTDKGNRKCSAEIVYRYITRNLDFEEAHTALADTEIEAEIFIACVNRRKKMHTELTGQIFRHPIWKERCKK